MPIGDEPEDMVPGEVLVDDQDGIFYKVVEKAHWEPEIRDWAIELLPLDTPGREPSLWKWMVVATHWSLVSPATRWERWE